MSTKPEPNAAYNAKVYEIAKILAKSIHGYAHDTSPPEVQEEDIDYYIPSARGMLAEMNIWYLQGISDTEAKSEVHLLGDSEVSALQKEYGLIHNIKTDNDA